MGFSDDRRSVRVETSQRSVTAKTLVVTAGPWVGTLVPDLSDRFRVYRQVMYWFDLVDKAEFEAYANLPVYIWEFGGRGREQFIYGFPMIDGPEGGVKVATEDYTTTTSPDAPILPVSQEEVELVYQDYVRDQLPGLGPTCVKAVSCLYTVTQDSRFIIDRHPSHPNVIVASPCSGHGFKHSAAIGEVLAQLVTCGSSDIDIAAFALTR
jgi:sarcosine oxidase